MRFNFAASLYAFASALAITSASPVLEARQEAVRFGVVHVDPTTVQLGQAFVVTYNSTLAWWQPEFLDVYIQGVYPNNFATPYYLLQRTSYSSDTRVLTFQTTLPVLDNDSTDGYNANGSYSIWAFITYPTGTGAYAVGGVSTPIGIDLS